MGGKVPRSCYLVNKTLEPKEKMQILSVRASSGGQKKLKFKVQVPNSTLRFLFSSLISDFFRMNSRVEDDAFDLSYSYTNNYNRSLHLPKFISQFYFSIEMFVAEQLRRKIFIVFLFYD